MTRRHALLALVILTTTRAAAPAAPPLAETAPRPPSLADALTTLETGAPLARGLKISGGYFAYCEKIGDCPPSRVLRIDKHPMQFQVYTEAGEELRGKKVDFTWELLTAEGEPVFDTTYAFEMKFIPEQVSAITYKRQPKQLRELAPGRYRYRVTALSDDGKHEAEWEKPVVARK